MRKIAAFMWAGISLCLATVINSCVHEIPAPLEGPNGPSGPIVPLPGCSQDTVYFEQQVLPLVNGVCGKSGCHGTTQPREFQLIYSSAGQSYNAIGSLFSSNSRLARALNEMGEQEIQGYVPPSAEQLAILQKWISQGRRNNSCNGCDTTQFAYAANVAPLFKYYCTGCHPAPGSQSTPNLSSYVAIKAELQNNPGRLLGSVQWTPPYNTATTKMPQGSNQLSACELEVIRKWIEAGAPNN